MKEGEGRETHKQSGPQTKSYSCLDIMFIPAKQALSITCFGSKSLRKTVPIIEHIPVWSQREGSVLYKPPIQTLVKQQYYISVSRTRVPYPNPLKRGSEKVGWIIYFKFHCYE